MGKFTIIILILCLVVFLQASGLMHCECSCDDCDDCDSTCLVFCHNHFFIAKDSGINIFKSDYFMVFPSELKTENQNSAKYIFHPPKY